jgi:hypothetical protein
LAGAFELDKVSIRPIRELGGGMKVCGPHDAVVLRGQLHTYVNQLICDVHAMPLHDLERLEGSHQAGPQLVDERDGFCLGAASIDGDVVPLRKLGHGMVLEGELAFPHVPPDVSRELSNAKAVAKLCVCSSVTPNALVVILL